MVERRQRLLIDFPLPPGDVVVLTAALLHAPADYMFNVYNKQRPVAPDLLAGHPRVDQSITPQNARAIIKLDLHKYLAAANVERNMHVTTAMTCALHAAMGFAYEPTRIRPFISMTPEEKQMKHRLAPDSPYIIIAPGAKTDFTAKQWSPAKWQQVVKSLRNDYTIVQIGATSKEHLNPKLSNVTNLVGKTTLRDLVQLVYHADGTICGVSLPMHIAGALEKPCVVIAGGREGAWWERYPEHSYLHLVDRLDCCTPEPCWCSHVDNGKQRVHGKTDAVCPHTVQEDILQPKCMTHISADDVITEAGTRFAEQHALASVSSETPDQSADEDDDFSLNDVAVCVCLYGTDTPGERPVEVPDGDSTRWITYHELHVRCLSSLQRVLRSGTQIILGCNTVDTNTLKWINENLPDAVVVASDENIRKYPMMRRMFEHVSRDWVFWLDDDSWFQNDRIEEEVQQSLMLAPELGVVGHMHTWELLRGQLGWIEAASWFKGRAPIFNSDRGCTVRFATGGFFVIRYDILKQLDWPDPRIDHNGGDVMLGAACRQLGVLMLNATPEEMGVAVSDACRRGVSQLPVGATAAKKLLVSRPVVTAAGNLYLDYHTAVSLLDAHAADANVPRLSTAIRGMYKQWVDLQSKDSKLKVEQVELERLRIKLDRALGYALGDGSTVQRGALLSHIRKHSAARIKSVYAWPLQPVSDNVRVLA